MPSFRDVRQMIGGQVFGKPMLPDDKDFNGKTVIVIGANTGVGFEAAKHIARMKVDHLILACRSLEKGLKAVEAIKTEIRPAGKIEVWQLDLANYQSVLAFGRRIETLPHLDGLIANAGLELQDFQLAERIEMQLCVNVVSTLLCAVAVLLKLKATAKQLNVQTNLTFQGSAYHIFAPDQQLEISKDNDIFDVLSRLPIDFEGRYALSKLMMHQCAHEIAERVSGEDVVINITHPGWAGTELSRAKESIPLGQMIGFKLIGWTAEKGSRPCVRAVIAGKETHGCYLSAGQPAPESDFMRSDSGKVVQRRVWKDLMARIKDISPETAAVIA